ncbi:flagellar filament capping protein FliD [Paenibacillus sp. Leaf72]|uniref:flagellar filament capping protein FliD n=1 Tax=Paenibacillus sp. Leaf72 TaxID=1736234 RepID=UPI0006F9809A|nr:flagellar filament capping protein FliD [Paenibacillus sp. Leaf72]KQO11010.1 hypothetical protein ASF12_11610 [Paenibacillus sp. Leaf72]
MRISGLASGMQVDDMVKEMMKAKRTSYNTMVQKRLSMEYQREAYREMSSKIVDFRNNKLQSYNMSNAIAAKTTEVTGNTSALTVNATNSSAAGSLNVSVSQVASAAGTVFTYNPDADTNTVNSTAGMKLTDLGFTAVGSDITVKVNDQAITLNAATATLSELASAINANKNAKASAYYNETTGQISIMNSQTGSTAVKLEGFNTITGFDQKAIVGKDAVISLNGVEYTQSSNRFEINGFDFTIKSESGANGVTTLSSVSDTNKIIDSIKSFVNDYNNLIGSINSKISEEKYRTYLPLTDEQKEGMEESQIKLWEDKAKSGLIRNDSILTKLVSDLRIAATPLVGGYDTGQVDGGGKAIYQSIGISTGSYTEKGKLVLNEETLRTALEKDPDKVIEMFTKRGTDVSPGSTESGVFAKMSASAGVSLQSLSTKAGTSLTSTELKGTFLESSIIAGQLRLMKERESSMITRLNKTETQLYKQFTAMETAINKFNSQASSLSSFSG